MDINIVRGIITLLLMLLFVGICIWAYSSARKADFEQASRLPLEQENDHE
ncbi:MAG: cbb3-type cytochrome c oxidase subunit 3 [Gammaproteobacteria bacterium]|nr:cbb3-type cytochrome c oxidase subunit 3 [Gammaproteobacteria bacterium]